MTLEEAMRQRGLDAAAPVPQPATRAKRQAPTFDREAERVQRENDREAERMVKQAETAQRRLENENLNQAYQDRGIDYTKDAAGRAVPIDSERNRAAGVTAGKLRADGTADTSSFDEGKILAMPPKPVEPPEVKALRDTKNRMEEVSSYHKTLVKDFDLGAGKLLGWDDKIGAETGPLADLERLEADAAAKPQLDDLVKQAQSAGADVRGVGDLKLYRDSLRQQRQRIVEARTKAEAAKRTAELAYGAKIAERYGVAGTKPGDLIKAPAAIQRAIAAGDQDAARAIAQQATEGFAALDEAAQKRVEKFKPGFWLRVGDLGLSIAKGGQNVLEGLDTLVADIAGTGIRPFQSAADAAGALAGAVVNAAEGRADVVGDVLSVTPGEGRSTVFADAQSDDLKARRQASREQIAAAGEGKEGWDKFTSEFGTAFREGISDPVQFTNTLAEQLPMLLPSAAAARIASKIAPAAKAAQAAKWAAVGAGAVMQGADVSDSTKEELSKTLAEMSAEDAGKVPGIATYLADGKSLEEAKAQFILDEARKAFAIGAGSSAAVNAIPGNVEDIIGRMASGAVREGAKGGVKGAVAGAAKAAAIEPLTEIPEEVAGRVATNRAVQKVDPNRSLADGLGETAAQAAVASVGTGAVVGGAEGARKAPPAAPAAAPASTPPPAEAPAPAAQDGDPFTPELDPELAAEVNQSTGGMEEGQAAVTEPAPATPAPASSAEPAAAEPAPTSAPAEPVSAPIAAQDNRSPETPAPAAAENLTPEPVAATEAETQGVAGATSQPDAAPAPVSEDQRSAESAAAVNDRMATFAERQGDTQGASRFRDIAQGIREEKGLAPLQDFTAASDAKLANEAKIVRATLARKSIKPEARARLEAKRTAIEAEQKRRAPAPSPQPSVSPAEQQTPQQARVSDEATTARENTSATVSATTEADQAGSAPARPTSQPAAETTPSEANTPDELVRSLYRVAQSFYDQTERRTVYRPLADIEAVIARIRQAGGKVTVDVSRESGNTTWNVEIGDKVASLVREPSGRATAFSRTTPSRPPVSESDQAQATTSTPTPEPAPEAGNVSTPSPRPADVSKNVPKTDTSPAPIVARGANTPAEFVKQVAASTGLKGSDAPLRATLDLAARLNRAAPEAFRGMEVFALSDAEWAANPNLSTQTPDSAAAYNPETNTLYLRTERVKEPTALVSALVHESGHFAERFALPEALVAREWAKLDDAQIEQAAADYNANDQRSAAEIRKDARARSEWVAQQFARVVAGKAQTVPAGIRARLEAFFAAMKEFASKWLGSEFASSAALDREVLRVMGVDEDGNKVAEEVTPPASPSPRMTIADVPRMSLLNKPIRGQNGTSIVGYEWRSEIGDKWSSREGALVSGRVSNWDRAATSEGTGRQIVHVYYVQRSDGSVSIEGINSAQNILGITQRRLQSIAETERLAQITRAKAEKQTAASYEKAKKPTAAEALKNYFDRNTRGVTGDYFAAEDRLYGMAVALQSGDGFVVLPNGYDADVLRANDWTQVPLPSRRELIPLRNPEVAPPPSAPSPSLPAAGGVTAPAAVAEKTPARPVFIGSLEAGQIAEDQREVTGNFKTKKAAEAEAAKFPQSEVVPYLNGKFKRGWLVLKPTPAYQQTRAEREAQREAERQARRADEERKVEAARAAQREAEKRPAPKTPGALPFSEARRALLAQVDEAIGKAAAEKGYERDALLQLMKENGYRQPKNALDRKMEAEAIARRARELAEAASGGPVVFKAGTSTYRIANTREALERFRKMVAAPLRGVTDPGASAPEALTAEDRDRIGELDKAGKLETPEGRALLDAASREDLAKLGLSDRYTRVAPGVVMPKEGAEALAALRRGEQGEFDVLGTPAERTVLNPPKNAEVPGSDGKQRYRSHTDTLLERGYDAVERVPYDVLTDAVAKERAKLFREAAGDTVAAAEVFNAASKLPGKIRVALGVEIERELAARRYDTKLTPEQRAEAVANFARFSQALAALGTEAGQTSQAFNLVPDILSADGALHAATQGAKKRQDQMLGEDGVKTEREIIDAMNAENGKVIDRVLDEAKADLRKVKVNKRMVERTVGKLPKSKKDVDSAIKQAFEATGRRVRDIIRIHHTEIDAIGTNLVDKLTQEAGLSEADAQKLAEAVRARMQTLTDKAKRAVLEKLAREKKGVSRRIFTLVDRIVEMSNAGALDQPALRTRIAEELKLPRVTDALAQRLKELTDKAQRTPEGFQRDRVETDILDELRKVKGIGPVDIATAIYYANILSGYTTQLVNIISTGLNVSAELANEVARSEADAILGRNGAKPGRATKQALAGFADGARTGFLQAASILKTGYATKAFDEKLPEVSPILELLAKEEAKGVMKGVKGYALAARYVTRAMKAADAVFFRSASEAYQRVAAAKLAGALDRGMDRAEANRKIRDMLAISPADFEAARTQAREEGLTGLDYQLRVGEIIHQKRNPAIVGTASRFAQAATFNSTPRGALGIIARKVGETAQAVPPLKLFVPFTNIVANVTNASLNYSPLGAVRAVRGYAGEADMTAAEREKAGIPSLADERASLAVKSAAGTMAMIALLAYGLAGDDDDMPIISATGPKNPDQRNQLRRSGWKPHSIKIGDTYVSYLTSPAAVPLAFVGNWIDGIRYNGLSEKDLVGAGTQAAVGIGSTITEMSFLQGVAYLFDTLRGAPGASPEKWAGNVATTALVPNLVRQIDRTFDPSLRQADGLGEQIQGAVPGLRQELPARLTPTGTVIESSPIGRFGGVATNDPLWDTLNAKGAVISDVRSAKVGNRDATPEELRLIVQESGPRIESRLRAALPAIRRMSDEQAADYVKDVAREERARARQMLPVLVRRAAGPPVFGG